MLVLTRGNDESVVVRVAGLKDIRITVCEIKAGRVKLGCEAERAVLILRGELADKPIAA